MAGFVGDAWAIVLAGGDGRRLLALSRALYGDDRPKQFAVLDGRSSLLQATMIRIGKSIPPARTLVVVASRWEHLARRQLQPFAGVRIVVQPRNLDTGPGILLPLSLVLDEDPDARVVVFPSDHFVPRPESLVSATSEALAAVASMGHRTVLLGIASEGPETSYGWIVPGETLAARTRVRSVLRFVEKPSLALARRLHAAGAYWNSFVLVARAVTLWETARLHLPALVGAFEAWRRGRSAARALDGLDRLYQAVGPASFSLSVLESAANLAVVPVKDTGWTDWGEPERVLRSLAASSGLYALCSRLIRRESAPILDLIGRIRTSHGFPEKDTRCVRS